RLFGATDEIGNKNPSTHVAKTDETRPGGVGRKSCCLVRGHRRKSRAPLRGDWRLARVLRRAGGVDDQLGGNKLVWEERLGLVWEDGALGSRSGANQSFPGGRRDGNCNA